MIHLLLRMLIDKQILDLALPRRSLIDSEAGRKLAMRADLDCVQHGDGEVLAIVADYVVGRAREAHVVDYHLACDMLGMLFEEANGAMCQTGLPEGFVIEARFPHGEGVPFTGNDSLVNVYDIEVFVLQSNHSTQIKTKQTNMKPTIQSS